jgi:hypothetical protein
MSLCNASDLASFEEAQETLALLKILALGNQDVAAGKVKPVADVVAGLWGEKAKQQRGLSARYTGTGYAIHHASSAFWASFFERSLAGQHRPVEIAKNAVLTAAGAAAFDYLPIIRKSLPVMNVPSGSGKWTQ